MGPGSSEGERPGGQTNPFEFTAHPIRFALYLALFIACLASVAGVLDVRALLAVVLLATALSDASLLRRVDWGLLATFVALFVFVGNMARVPLLHDALAAAVDEQRAAGGRRCQPGYQQRARRRAAVWVHRPVAGAYRGHEPRRPGHAHRVHGKSHHVQGRLSRPSRHSPALPAHVHPGQRSISDGTSGVGVCFWAYSIAFDAIACPVRLLAVWPRAIGKRQASRPVISFRECTKPYR